MKVAVTVELEFSTMPDDAAKELARQITEARGLNVTRVAMVAAPKGDKEFRPKAGAAGSLKIVGGVGYTVWSDGPNAGERWAMKASGPDGFVDLLGSNRGHEYASKYHYNGRPHNAYGTCSTCEEKAA